MKTYGATDLFDRQGHLVTTDALELGRMITEAETKSISTNHEVKLARIEIGLAIRQIASINNTTLTEAIVQMDLCKTEHRADKTFLKYARIAGSATLMEMAENPQISLSVLDEIAASKKPDTKLDQARFLKRVGDDVAVICRENLEHEGYDPDKPEGRQIVLGITRNQAVGIIRRVQMEMGVQTKAGNGNGPERPGDKEIQSKLLQLLNLIRVMYLPPSRSTAWMDKYGLSARDVTTTMLALQSDLVGAGILPEEADSLKPESIKGLKKLAQPVPELDEVI